MSPNQSILGWQGDAVWKVWKWTKLEFNGFFESVVGMHPFDEADG